MIAYVFQHRRGTQCSRLFTARVRLANWPAPKTFPLHVTDKRVAEQKLRDLVTSLEQESMGFIPPKAARVAIGVPTLEHLTTFLADVEARGRAKNTVRAYKVVLNALVRDCGWKMLNDITADSFERWRAQRSANAKYANDCLGYARTFVAWLVRKKRLLSDPLKDVEKARVRRTASHRRALTTDEISRLLASVSDRRATVYLVALYTGLRRNELNGLRWLDFELDLPVPVVRVSSAIAKNGTSVVLPLRPEVVAAVRNFKPASAAPGDRAFFGKVPNMDTFKRDLAQAGIAYLDEAGRKVDFHALRTTFGTQLAVAGVAPRVAMEMMRHSDLKLTTKVYTDSAHLPVSAALQCLPSWNVGGTDTQGSTQTGVNLGHPRAFNDTGLQNMELTDSSLSIAIPATNQNEGPSKAAKNVVDPIRIELTTSSMPLRRSAN